MYIFVFSVKKEKKYIHIISQTRVVRRRKVTSKENRVFCSKVYLFNYISVHDTPSSCRRRKTVGNFIYSRVFFFFTFFLHFVFREAERHRISWIRVSPHVYEMCISKCVKVCMKSTRLLLTCYVFFFPLQEIAPGPREIYKRLRICLETGQTKAVRPSLFAVNSSFEKLAKISYVEEKKTPRKHLLLYCNSAILCF